MALQAKLATFSYVPAISLSALDFSVSNSPFRHFRDAIKHDILLCSDCSQRKITPDNTCLAYLIDKFNSCALKIEALDHAADSYAPR